MTQHEPHAAPSAHDAAPGLHIDPIPTYLAIFGALMVLSLATVWAAFHDFGAFNNLIALAIAGTKAVLVILFFMHLRHSSRVTRLVAVAGFGWLFILVGFTLADYFTRGLVSLDK